MGSNRLRYPWQLELIDAINATSFKQSEKEPCMFFKYRNAHTSFIGTYVDDFLITGDNHKEVKSIEKYLASRFQMKNMGELKRVLGIKSTMIQNGIILTQTEYSNSIVKKFGQEHCYGRKTPMDNTYDPSDDQHYEQKYPIREAIRSLMYQQPKTGHHLAVNSLARHVSRPNKKN